MLMMSDCVAGNLNDASVPHLPYSPTPAILTEYRSRLMAQV